MNLPFVEAAVPEVSDVLVSVAANRHPLVTSTKCSKKGSVRLKFKVKSESMAIEGKLEEFPIISLSFELKDEEKEEKEDDVDLFAEEVVLGVERPLVCPL